MAIWMHSSSVSPTASTSPVTSECNLQPPSSSAGMSSPMAREVTLGLDTAITAPFSMIETSDMAEYQVELP